MEPMTTCDCGCAEFLTEALDQVIAFDSFVADGGWPREIYAIEEMFEVTWDDELSDE